MQKIQLDVRKKHENGQVEVSLGCNVLLYTKK